MMDFLYLVPIALLLGGAGLAAFMWCLRSGQYDDLDGAAERILFDDDTPLRDQAHDIEGETGRAVTLGSLPGNTKI